MNLHLLLQCLYMLNVILKEEIDKAFGKLSECSKILIPLGAYPFSERFGWVNDKYGVSWQLTFEKK